MLLALLDREELKEYAMRKQYRIVDIQFNGCGKETLGRSISHIMKRQIADRLAELIYINLKA